MKNCARNRRSRGWQNLPDIRALLRLGRALIEQYCGSFRQVPKRIVLDIDDTFDRVHGEQQLRLFNAYHDDYGFQPIVVFDGEGRFVTALLRPGKRPGGREIAAFVRRLVGAIRAQWPRVEILLRADSHYAAPEVFDWCRVNRVDWVLGLASNPAFARSPCRCAGENHRRALPGGAQARQVTALRAILRCRPQLEPGRAHHRPGRGRTRGHRHPLYRDQSRRGPRQASLQGAPPPARPGGEPHQGVEKPPRCRPNLLPTRPRPTSSACSCTPAPTGCCGRCDA